MVVGEVQALVAPNGKGSPVQATSEGRGGGGRGGTPEVEKEKRRLTGGEGCGVVRIRVGASGREGGCPG